MTTLKVIKYELAVAGKLVTKPAAANSYGITLWVVINFYKLH